MTSKIYTRRGDKGQTSLIDGTRVPKDSQRVAAYGTVDEANSWVGLARANCSDPLLDRVLELVQHRLYNCSSNLATPPGSGIAPTAVSQADVDFLERAIDRLEERAGSLDHFVLPGGTVAAGFLHVARTVCRRAEREMVRLAAGERVDPTVLKFVNRSSDLLFAAARYAAAIDGPGDLRWDRDLPLPEL